METILGKIYTVCFLTWLPRFPTLQWGSDFRILPNQPPQKLIDYPGNSWLWMLFIFKVKSWSQRLRRETLKIWSLWALMTQRVGFSAYTQEPGAIWDALVYLRHPTVLAKGHRAEGRWAVLGSKSWSLGLDTPELLTWLWEMVFRQPNPALTHTYKIYIIKSISHSINHRRYFQIFGFHVSSGGNLSSISTLRTVLETHYSLHWHFQACWSTQLAQAPCSHPRCSCPLLHPLFLLQLYHRLQEKEQRVYFFFFQRRGVQKAGGEAFPLGKAVTRFMVPWGVIEGAGTWSTSSSGAALPQKVSALTEKQDIFSLPSVFKSSWSTLKL